MAAKTFVYQVDMSCQGCVNSISNVLNRHKDKGIQDYNVNLKDKIVTVQTTMEPGAVLEIIQKTGKDVKFVTEMK